MNEEVVPLKQAMLSYVSSAYIKCGRNQLETSRRLKINRNTVHKYLKQAGARIK